VQLLSEPYTNSSRNKVQIDRANVPDAFAVAQKQKLCVPNAKDCRIIDPVAAASILFLQGNLPWVVEHAETCKGDQQQGQAEQGLRDRGLCLVPVSWTPEVYRDGGTAMDYWTPAYRGCLYR